MDTQLMSDTGLGVEDNRCDHIKQDGERCQALRRSGSTACFFHDPESHTQHLEATRRGGRNAHRAPALLPKSAPDRPIRSVRDVAQLLAETIHQVRTGDLDPRIANSVGYLSGHLLRAVQLEELERRLLSVEAQVKEGVLVTRSREVFCESIDADR